MDILHSFGSGDDADRAARMTCVINAAFYVGFLSHAAPCYRKYWNPPRLRKWWNYFSTQLNPATFEVLKVLLAELEAKASALFQLPDAIAAMESAGAPRVLRDEPLAFDGVPPAIDSAELLPDSFEDAYAGQIAVHKWMDDCVRFRNIVRDAVLETSPYRIWFDCGRWFGEFACEAMLPGHWPIPNLRNLHQTMRFLQQSVAKLPPPFLNTFYWLKGFRDFDFQAGDPADWATQVPRHDGLELRPFMTITSDGCVRHPEGEEYEPLWAAGIPKVVDFATLVAYFYQRFSHALDRVGDLIKKGLTLVPSSPQRPSAIGGTTEGAVGAAGDNVNLPALEGQAAGMTMKRSQDKRIGPQWNGKTHEFLIDGVVVYAYKRKAKNQFLVLEAFEAEGWPTVIDTPIDDSKQRTQTLKELNERVQGKIKFRGDGTGECIKWERPGRKQRKRPAD